MKKIFQTLVQKEFVEEVDSEETSNDLLNTNFQDKNQEQESFGSFESRSSKIKGKKSIKKYVQKSNKQKISQMIKEAREFGKQQPKENIFSQYITLEDMSQFVDLIRDLQAQIKIKGDENIFLKKKINKIEKSFEEKISLQVKQISILKEFQYDYRQKMQLQIKAMRKNIKEVEKNLSLIQAKVEEINQECDENQDSNQHGTKAQKYARQHGLSVNTALRHLRRIRADIAKQEMTLEVPKLKDWLQILSDQDKDLGEGEEKQIEKIEYISEEEMKKKQNKVKPFEKGSTKMNKEKSIYEGKQQKQIQEGKLRKKAKKRDRRSIRSSYEEYRIYEDELNNPTRIRKLRNWGKQKYPHSRRQIRQQFLQE